jgi:hypothetical protein
MKVGCRRSAWIGLALIVSLAVGAGCGGRRAERSAALETAQQVEVLLPEWAPENPSPEFLRAGRVLKPLPLDFMSSPGRTDAENAARMHGAALMWPAAYAFFGTLSDKQVERFLQAKPKYMVIPVKQLTERQRDALNGYFDAWREAWKGRAAPESSGFADCLVILYKMGANRDLSNVAVGFDAGKEMGGGHIVHICFQVTNPEGKTDGFGPAFAQIWG